MMTLKKFFEEQVFIRLTEDQNAFICTTKWPLLSRIRRINVSEAVHDSAPRVTELTPAPLEELPMLRCIRLEGVRPS